MSAKFALKPCFCVKLNLSSDVHPNGRWGSLISEQSCCKEISNILLSYLCQYSDSASPSPVKASDLARPNQPAAAAKQSPAMQDSSKPAPVDFYADALQSTRVPPGSEPPVITGGRDMFGGEKKMILIHKYVYEDHYYLYLYIVFVEECFCSLAVNRGCSDPQKQKHFLIKLPSSLAI